MNAQTATDEPRLVQRAEREWSEIAGERVSVLYVTGRLYALGSELACLRLYLKWRGRARCKYSTNLETWYFTPSADADG